MPLPNFLCHSEIYLPEEKVCFYYIIVTITKDLYMPFCFLFDVFAYLDIFITIGGVS